MGTGLYVLDGHEPRECSDTLSWARWFETAKRVVAQERPFPDVEVSTVFLGTDHRFLGDGPPLLFETMVFGGTLDGAGERCSTWDDAWVQHLDMLARVIRSETSAP